MIARVHCFVVLLAFGAVTACSTTTVVPGSAGNGASDNGSSPDADGGTPTASTCRGRSFGAAKDWTLPMPAASVGWQQGTERYALLDIHGDGKPDLVITGRESDKTLGVTKWLVFKNNGSEFEATPEAWSLPMPAAGTSWLMGYERYSLVDIHGDGKPDLVITGRESDKTIGETKWLVFKNDGTSFSSTPEVWSLPTPAGSTNWQTGYERYALVDIHGDGKPDLVITGKEKDKAIGETKWLVFKNDGSSFSKTAETWSLPMRAAGTSWQQGYERYSLVDIHGDGKPDLVITGRENDKELGKTRWDVYPNSGTAFDSKAEPWALAKPAESVGWNTGESRFALIDIHGDKRPDLVFTGLPGDSALGKTKWSVHSNDCE